MIISFSVSNFRSFCSEETFSLVASNRLSGNHDEHAVPIPDSKEKVLRAGVIYGANGAGKSNLFRALQYLKSVALRPLEKDSGTGREIFRFREGMQEPSSFDLQFIAAGKLYRFGFKANDQRITEEWLVQVYGGKERVLYERITDENGRVSIDFQGLRSAGEKLNALATVGGPQNQSFLATIHVTLNSSDCGEELNAILAWFKRLYLIAPSARFAALSDFLVADPDFKEFAGDFLQSSGTGVDALNIFKREITEDELRSLLSENDFLKLLNNLQKSDDGIVSTRLNGGNELLIERAAANRFFRITIQAVHEQPLGKPIPLELAEESDGTRRLLNLIPALYDLQGRNAIYFVDEIDRSLHPILVMKFLEFFLKSCEGGQRQIVITTHESNLLDLDLLRRDEIWFAEKDRDAATRLYSMADFKVRKDHEIRKHYLQGRFGAVPFLGSFDHLLAGQGKAE
jgi:AAA15 family ATPase/GTPase